MKNTECEVGSRHARSNRGSGRALLSCRRLRRNIAGRTILTADQLVLERGRTYLLTGANGAGKTSLLRVLAGLDRAQCQHLEFDGTDISSGHYPRHVRRQLGFVHHQPVMFSSSLARNIGFGLRAIGMPKPEMQRRTQAAIEWAGISSLVNRPPQALSAGEKQRVALARAHALDPALYLLDEPTANLDEEGRILVTNLIDAIAQEERTLLIACHDRELLGLDGVVHLFMRDGRVDVAS
ncbi:MAG: ATP-binding cassette domain-containing protein [Burkholderiales bacterium]|nr:ATP-binding cassette domain-containing protein [Burkholderiales bacterium]